MHIEAMPSQKTSKINCRRVGCVHLQHGGSHQEYAHLAEDLPFLEVDYYGFH